MQSELQATERPLLDDATRSFVRRSLDAGLVELGDLKKVVAALMAESAAFTPERLASGLQGAGILTEWQSNKLLAGKCRGFYLGSYRLLRPLGKGGMGIVYLGEHHVMKRLMALKILPPHAADDARRIERFKSEARACAQLDHPNIVRAYDFSQAGDRLFIVMEYVDGIDLHYAVQRDGPMSVADAIDVLTQAARGLSHAHERGIVHRDMKPSNLLLRSDGVIKLSDLGLARIGSMEVGEKDPQRLMGTADFVAPEQAINSAAADSRADIYSLGCTLYFLLSGRSPFDGTAAQRLAKHQTAPVPDIRTLRSDCPAAVAELISRMTAKLPESRHKSASELVAQLERIGGFSSERALSRLRNVSPADDTAVDDSLYQATIEDTSLSAGGEVVITDQVGEFDFASLPPIEAVSDSAVPLNPIRSNDTASGKSVKVKRDRNTASSLTSGRDGNQQVLLGVGLAVAVIALVGVLGLGLISLSQPLPTTLPTIKSVERENGQQVFIIRE